MRTQHKKLTINQLDALIALNHLLKTALKLNTLTKEHTEELYKANSILLDLIGNSK